MTVSGTEAYTNGWYLFNAHGDVVQLTDSTGTFIKEYVYDAFGNEKNIDPNDNNLFRYCSEYFDKETGDIYLRARYYSPDTGRFSSEDSFTGNADDPLSLNLYTYCTNNPISFHDPTGHMNYWTQSHLLFGGYTQKGYELVNQFSPHIFNTVMNQMKQGKAFAGSVASMATAMYQGDLDWSGLASLLGSKATDALIGDLLYIKNNYEQFSTDVKISDNQAWELGRRTAGAIFELEQAGFTVISFSSALRGARNVAKGTGSLEISSNTVKHINNRHNPSTYAQQLKYKSEASALKELQNKSFFNKNWSSNQIKKAVNYGYNKAVAKGISTGNYTFKYAGEIVTISFRDGALQSDWGSHKYTYEQLLKLTK